MKPELKTELMKAVKKYKSRLYQKKYRKENREMLREKYKSNWEAREKHNERCRVYRLSKKIPCEICGTLINPDNMYKHLPVHTVKN